MLPDTIDFRVTPECNMRCPFCFGPRQTQIVALSSQIDFLKKLRKNGVKNIVITGGEPTLFPEIIPLLKALKSFDYHIVLLTNGVFWDLESIRNTILDCVSTLSLPLESADPEIHNQLRIGFPNHFAQVKQVLESISTRNPRMQIRISSVVTKKNLHHLQGTLDTLPFAPEVWKLYQLSACSHNSPFYAKQSVSDEEFTNCIRELRSQYAGTATKIISAYEHDRNRKYLFLEPDGTLLTIVDNQECVIGHIADDAAALYTKVEEMVNCEKINANFYESF